MSRKIHRQRRSIFELHALEIRRFLTTASINNTTHTLEIVGTDSAETIFINGVASGARVTVTGVPATGTLTQFVIGTGNNQFNKINVDAKGGNDTVTISSNFTYSGGATVHGGFGADVITGGRNNDNLLGEGDNDQLDGQGGADILNGGGQQDVANYSSRTEAIKVSLDGSANDGNNNGGEGDNVMCVEVWTGSGNDVVDGGSGNDSFGLGAGSDVAHGNDGNDNITAAPGGDNIFGGRGSDFLQALNQDTDHISVGKNAGQTDFLSNDPSDVLDLTSPLVRVSGGDPSDLDTTYNDTGKFTGPNFDWSAITAATVDSQGRSIVVGYAYTGYGYDFAVTRHTADGALDTFFGNGYGYGGDVKIDFGTNFGTGYSDDDFANGVTTDSAGNIYIVGQTDDAVNGSFDGDFGIAKLDSNGNLLWTRQYDITDASEGSGFYDEALRVVVQNDGKIDVAGTHQTGVESDNDFAIVRLNSNGDLDTSFNAGVTPGMNTFGFGSGNQDYATGLALQTLPGDDGAQRIVVGGSTNFNVSFTRLGGQETDFALTRFNSDGTLDGTFGTNGAVTTPFLNADTYIHALAVDSANQIFAVGSATVQTGIETTQNEGALARYDSAGNNAITHLEDNGTALAYNGAALDSSGRLVAVGTDGNDFAIARYNSDLSNDSAFNGGEVAYTDFTVDSPTYSDTALAARVLDSGKIVVGGSSEFGEGAVQASSARYLGDFTPIVTLGTDDIRNPDGPLADRLAGLSAGTQLYIKSQPDENGRVIIDLPESPDVAKGSTTTNSSSLTNVVKFSIVTAGDGKKMLAVSVNGEVLYYDQSTTTLLTINGTSGNDQILSDELVTIPMIIDGKGGNDVLHGGRANDVIFGGPGNDLLDGESGNDVLVGGDGNDGLTGETGRSILIGGKGNDGLLGWSDQDILIGGTTAYDTNLAALQSLIAEWGKNTPFNTRVANLRNGGGANGTNVLTVGVAGTVLDDNAIDGLAGLGGQDWFFAHKSGSNKDTTDFKSNTDILDAV